MRHRRLGATGPRASALGLDCFVPLIDARRAEALGALDVRLTPLDMTTIETAVPKGAAAGERYAPAEMARLDSERPG